MIIYKITNLINGKAYIGQTKRTLASRFKQHCQLNRKRSCPKLLAAIRKYGKENFTAEILEICTTQEALNEREVFWIKNYNTFNDGYNLSTGGSRYELSAESRKKISESLIGRPNPRKGIPSNKPAWNKGKPWADERRKKMSDAHKRPDYKPPKGWKHSEEFNR